MRDGNRVRAFATMAALTLAAGWHAQARARPPAWSSKGGLPYLDVQGSCSDAQKFSNNRNEKGSTFEGCMQDETKAKTELAKNWSSYKVIDRHDCLEQSRSPSPSYVEVLTCLEMSSDPTRKMPKNDAQPVPQLGGFIAPGLTTRPAPMPATALPPSSAPSQP